MIPGSGAQDRDDTILDYEPFTVVADRLTRDCIAVLRMSDRGFADKPQHVDACTIA